MTKTKVTNKQKLEIYLEGKGLELGCYNNDIDRLSVKEFKKISSDIDDYDYTDIPTQIRKAKHIVEIGVVDNEVDFNIMSKTDYLNQYGDEYEYKFQ